MKTTFLFAVAMAILLTDGLVFAQDTTLTIVNGNVGIGTTSPGAKLDVHSDATYGMIRVVSNDGSKAQMNVYNSGEFLLNSYATGGYSPGSIRLCPGDVLDSRSVYITSTGKVGIGTTSPSATLEVKVGGTTLADAWSTRSSRRWKSNVKTLVGALETVGKLRGVTFNGKKDGKPDIGLIAEEVGEVIPEVVQYEENGRDAKSVDYARLVAVLIEGMKEQQKQIDELKARLTILNDAGSKNISKLTK